VQGAAVVAVDLDGPAADEAEVAGLLDIASQEHAPAAVGDGHEFVRSVDVYTLAGQGTAADVHDDEHELAGDGVEDLLHKDAALDYGGVGPPSAGDGDALLDAGTGVLMRPGR